MVLPLYLARTNAELFMEQPIPGRLAYMACFFSPYTLGLSGIPSSLPEESMLILNDRTSCQGHSPDLVVGQLEDAVARLHCESVLLDFQRPPDSESIAMVGHIVQSLSSPVAVTEPYAKKLDCPVFLSPVPLHIPLVQHLEPWNGREIWLEAAMGQSEVHVTPAGITVTNQFPPAGLTDGYYEEILCCHYLTKVDPEHITFTLFDTPEDLKKKLKLAQSLGVTRAVGLWQELKGLQ